jgi:hypothetical protein
LLGRRWAVTGSAAGRGASGGTVDFHLSADSRSSG